MNLLEIEEYLAGIVELRKRIGTVRGAGWRYGSFEELVLSEGTRFERREAVALGKPKMCFKNALHLALEQPDHLYYCEGWGTSVIPVEHAWCCDRDGVVYDPTWGGEEDRTYVGVVFDPEQALAYMLSSGTYGMFFTGRGGELNEALLRGDVPLVQLERKDEPR